MRIRIARNVTKREYFELEVADETAADALLHQLNTKITNGSDYSIEDDYDGEFIDERDVDVGDNLFEDTGWRE